MTRGQGGGPKRRKPADIHSVAVHVRLTPAEAARLDAVRGETPRAAVLRTGGMAEVARRERRRGRGATTSHPDDETWLAESERSGLELLGIRPPLPNPEPGEWEGAPGDVRVCWWSWDSHGWKSGAAEVWPDGRWTAWTPGGVELASGTAPTQPEAEAAARAALGEYAAKQGRTP